MNDEAKILAGRYEVGDLIGRGGMAEVHIGYDTRLGRTVAIKVLRADLARDPSFQTRFRREAQAAAGLNHPAIVAVYDTGEDTILSSTGQPQAVPFIVMEYVEGHTVRDILKGDVAAPIDEAIEITTGVLTALDYSHHAGLVHRDIKPGNVMLTPTGAVKVMDFGIARALADAGQTMTQTQAVVGTAQYLSPEQARGENVDTRSDLYSVGCLLFELLTGRPPFIGDSPVSVAYQHVREEAPLPSQFASDVPPELDQIVMRALKKSRDERYATAQEFLADLRSVAGGGSPNPTTGAIAVGSAAFGAGVAGVAAAQGMTPEEIEQQDTQMMPAQEGAPDTGATEIMSGVQSTQIMPGAAAPWANVAGGMPGPVPPQTGPESAAVATVTDEEDRRRKLILYISLGAAALIAVIVLIFLFSRGGAEPEPSPSVLAVPVLAGMTEQEARSALEALDLIPAFETEASEDVEVDLVIRTDPADGAAVVAGDTVTVYLSSGSDVVVIPSVKGVEQAQARGILESAGLVIGEVRTDHDPTIAENRATKTEPAENSEVAKGSEVILFVSDGNVELPDVTGMSEAEARAALTELGLTPDVSDVVDDSVEPGTVLDQRPTPGLVPQRSVVQLSISAQATTVQVPNVVGKSKNQAESELSAAGLSFTYGSDQFDPSIPAGSIKAQNPSGGITVDKDTTVTLTLSKGPEPAPTAPTASAAP